jgi:DNA-directed RNA polymerase specialized sigma24 family protein
VRGAGGAGVDERADGEAGADPIADPIAEVADPERIVTAREMLRHRVRAFRALPERQQLALELVRVEGFSLATAAENRGVTIPSLKTSVSRGAAALRQALLEEGKARQVREPSAVKKEPLRGIS